MANKSFRLWKKDGEPINLEASRIEFAKEKDGLAVKLYGVGKVRKMKGIVALTEVMPPIVFERK